MKKISLGVLAILLASATVFANDIAKKPVVKKAKQECEGKCLKTSKTGTCKDSNSCPDMKTCGAKCS
jgi:hypothetical protein